MRCNFKKNNTDMQHIRLENLLFIDIETVPQQSDFAHLGSDWQSLWAEKVRWQLPAGTTAEDYYPQRAGIMAEFAKLVCGSMGYFRREADGGLQLRIKSFCGHDERQLLTDMLADLKDLEAVNNRWVFTGHNIKEFAIPFLCRRLLANGIAIPPSLDFQNMKPWTVNILDTFQYWRFGDYRNYTSLKLLAATLGIPSPKSDMEGSMVADIYYKEHDLERIAAYCQQDVVAIANIVCRFKNLPLLAEGDVVVVK
jgi:3'-5' exonuclease